MITKTRDDLKVKEDGNGRCHIENLTEYSVRSYDEFNFWLNRGANNKLKRKTVFNNQSSRSHTILELCLLQTHNNAQNAPTRENVFTFCDLAGSERFSDDQLLTKSHKLETKNINLSLTHLGR